MLFIIFKGWSNIIYVLKHLLILIISIVIEPILFLLIRHVIIILFISLVILSMHLVQSEEILFNGWVTVQGFYNRVVEHLSQVILEILLLLVQWIDITV